MIRRAIRSSILCGTAPDAEERIFPKQVLFPEAPAFFAAAEREAIRCAARKYPAGPGPEKRTFLRERNFHMKIQTMKRHFLKN